MKRVMIPIKGKDSDELFIMLYQVFNIFSLEDISISNPVIELIGSDPVSVYLSFNTKYHKRSIEVLGKHAQELDIDIDIKSCFYF